MDTHVHLDIATVRQPTYNAQTQIQFQWDELHFNQHFHPCKPSHFNSSLPSLDNHSLYRNNVYGLGSMWDCPPLVGRLCFHDPTGYEMMSCYSPHQGQTKPTFVLSEDNTFQYVNQHHCWEKKIYTLYVRWIRFDFCNVVAG